MKTGKLLKSILFAAGVAVGTVALAAGSSGDVFEFRPCDKDGKENSSLVTYAAVLSNSEPVPLAEAVRGIELRNMQWQEGSILLFEVGFEYADDVDPDVAYQTLESSVIRFYKADSLGDCWVEEYEEHISSLAAGAYDDWSFCYWKDDLPYRSFYRVAISDDNGSVISSNIACITRRDDGEGYYVTFVGDDFDTPSVVVTEDMWMYGDWPVIVVAPGETIRFCYNLGDIDENYFGYGDGESLVGVLASSDDWMVLNDSLCFDYIPNSSWFDFMAPWEEGSYFVGFTHEDYIWSGYLDDICGFEVVVVPTYAVTFDLGTHGTCAEGGEIFQYVNSGCLPNVPDVVPDSGWVFVGWDPDPTIPVYSNMTFTALWSGTFAIETTELPLATEMVPYSFELTAVNGTPPYAWSVPNSYSVEHAEHSYSSTGIAQGWNADDGSWLYNLPFEFPFYGQQL